MEMRFSPISTYTAGKPWEANPAILLPPVDRPGLGWLDVLFGMHNLVRGLRVRDIARMERKRAIDRIIQSWNGGSWTRLMNYGRRVKEIRLNPIRIVQRCVATLQLTRWLTVPDTISVARNVNFYRYNDIVWDHCFRRWIF